MILRVGDTRVTVDRDDHGPYVATTFADGTEVLARPIHEPWEDTRLHDLLHTLIADARGEPHSMSLWLVAHPDERTDELDRVVAFEEARVLKVQGALRAVLDS